jgi:hypothetical protein
MRVPVYVRACLCPAVANIALAFCDVCNSPLRFGDWWHKMGAGYDLCCKHHTEMAKGGLSQADAAAAGHDGEQESSQMAAGSNQQQLEAAEELAKKFVEVKSEQQIEDNNQEFKEYLRNSQIMPFTEQLEEAAAAAAAAAAAGVNAGAVGDADDEAAQAAMAEDSDDDDDDDDDSSGEEDDDDDDDDGEDGQNEGQQQQQQQQQQVFVDIDDFIVNGLNGMHGGMEVWVEEDEEEMVEVTAASGEGDGDILLQ